MYITNNPEVAQIVQNAGVDRIWVDMEWIGKEERQAGMNTVKSHHTIEDIARLRPIVTTSTLMARVNLIHEATGNKETVGAGCGYAVETGNAQALMVAVERVIFQGKESFSTNCREWVAKKFDKQTMKIIFSYIEK